jgi:oligopeptidase A|tara:strand:+ start:4101 stop:6152 length:2052 start_codon:yes stop_codon:yes gene_type:complete
MTTHPFLSTALEAPWTDLSPEHIVPDMDAAIVRAEAEISQLVAQPLDAVTYASTFATFETLVDQVSNAWGLISHLESVDNTEAFRAAFKIAQPKVTRFFSGLPLNAEIWKVLKAFGESSAVSQLLPVQQRFVEETMNDFRESGADLPDAKKDRLMAIAEELAKITTQYGENHLDTLNAFELVVEDEARLAGLPESARAAALQEAKEKKLGTDDQPVWRFTLQAPSFMPVMRYAEDRELRRDILNAYYALATEAPHANEPLIWDILRLRQEQAEILGMANFADHVLSRRMAKNGKAALAFEEDLHSRIAPRFRDECDELQEFKAKSGDNSPMEAWDVGYWSEKLRMAECSFDEESLRPYFQVNRVIEGLFSLTEELFGVRVVERTGDAKPPVWHPDVQAFDIFDSKTNRHCGLFYTDWFPRETKRSGAWMTPMRSESGDKPCLGAMAGNMTRPLGDQPALLLHGEVETVFHEFGHLLHHLLSEVEVASLGGTDVAWDFVELPSQILENWCWERVSLDRFARHHETGEPIPEEIFKNLLKTKTFRSASFMVRQLAFGRTDLMLHLNATQLLAEKPSLEDWWRDLNAEYLTPLASQPRSNLRTFGHLFSDAVGYAAGYYSYMWADVLASDAFSRFEADGVMNSETGHAFRESILSKGNSAPPEELFRNFMGRNPDPEALLKARGLA